MSTSFDDAVSALRSWYYSKVRKWATKYDQRIKEREFSDRETFFDTLHKETNGATCIIYTMQAKVVCLASDNEDAYEDEIGEPAPTVEAKALFAFQRDIQEAMASDLTDADTFEPAGVEE